jgi:hypothetical protein
MHIFLVDAGPYQAEVLAMLLRKAGYTPKVIGF